MRRPKYLNVLTDSRAEPLSIMGVLGDNGDLFREMCFTLHFDSLKVMQLEVAQESLDHNYLHHSVEL